MNKLTDLRYDIYDYKGIHPQDKMKELGIIYQHATPQTMGDSWQFWNCENVPEELPNYITREIYDPLEWIGYGLSKENAEKIKHYRIRGKHI